MLRLVAPGLLVVVAVLGAWRHVEEDLTAWRGGTIGMFALVDAPANRLVRGTILEPDGDERVAFPPPEVADEAARAKVHPTDDNLRRLHDAWRAVAPAGHDLLAVEVLRTVYDAGPREIRLERVHLVGVASSGDEAITSSREVTASPGADVRGSG